jgi:UDP-N-acetylmuramoyl-L-alanyl-D-glutamate--2,6-diaminopimelate ligase
MYLDIFLNRLKRLIPKKLFKFLQPLYHFILSGLAALYYCHPSEELIVIGVTGTTGKTTCVYLIAKILESAGYKTGFTSTAMFNDGRSEWLNDKKMTMAGRFFMQKMLRTMVKNKCQYAIVETTSEGIAQFRHRFINYDILVYTGLYPEHIESHGSFEKYKLAKGKLFFHLKRCHTKYINENHRVVKAESGLKKINLQRIKKTIIGNGDDENLNFFMSYWADRKIIYSTGKNTSPAKDMEIFNYGSIKSDSQGISFVLDKNRFNLNLLGAFNACNAMAAICLGISQALSIDKIKDGIQKIKGIPGRLEIINEGQNFTVIVDYAFEPKAVEKLYETISLFKHEKIIHVLGSCGGGRDIARRPELGKIAGANADFVIITNEDPYDDDPNIIIDQISLGAEAKGKRINKDLFKILDRHEAINKAISLAAENDIIIITGKGSEQAICVANGNKLPWDDRTVVRGLLAELK